MATLDNYRAGPGMAGAEMPFDAAGQVGRLVQLLGGVLSTALVAGLALWGYQLLMRDVNGIPVIRAAEGPMRVQPAEPGGDRAAHQGLAVNRIAAEGEAAPPAEAIVLAPRSADLQAEDLAQGLLRATPAVMVAPAAAPRLASAEANDPVAAAILAATTEVMAAEAELSGDGLLAGGPMIIPASVPGLTRSLRPPRRPEGLAPAAAAATGASPAAGEIDAASLPSGTKLVQFGAFDSAEEARATWEVLAGRFGALLADKGRVIEPASAGGRDFYRLRALGFADAADARRFCAAFVAEGSDCIPVAVR